MTPVRVGVGKNTKNVVENKESDFHNQTLFD